MSFQREALQTVVTMVVMWPKRNCFEDMNTMYTAVVGQVMVEYGHKLYSAKFELQHDKQKHFAITNNCFFFLFCSLIFQKHN